MFVRYPNNSQKLILAALVAGNRGIHIQRILESCPVFPIFPKKNMSADNTFDPNYPATRRLLRTLNTPWKMFLFQLQRLPSMFFWGGRIQYVDPYRAEIALPYSWRTQNPFRSIYFAAQCGAAEYSTGLLALIAIKGRGRISMLVADIQAEFVKKATSKTVFTCKEGDRILEAVQKAIDTGEGQTVTVTSTGVQATGEVVSRVRLTWTFKIKQ